jgi:hypothetical protein
VLIDKALNRGYVLSPLTAPHHRRDGLVFRGPSDKGKQSRPSPGGGRGNPSLTYEQSFAKGPVSAHWGSPARRRPRLAADVEQVWRGPSVTVLVASLSARDHVVGGAFSSTCLSVAQ